MEIITVENAIEFTFVRPLKYSDDVAQDMGALEVGHDRERSYHFGADGQEYVLLRDAEGYDVGVVIDIGRGENRVVMTIEPDSRIARASDLAACAVSGSTMLHIMYILYEM